MILSRFSVQCDRCGWYLGGDELGANNGWSYPSLESAVGTAMGYGWQVKGERVLCPLCKDTTSC